MKRMSRQYHADGRNPQKSTVSDTAQGKRDARADDNKAKPGSVPTEARYRQGYFPVTPPAPTQSAAPARPRRYLYRITLGVLACVFLFASFQVIQYFVKSHQAKQEERMVQAMIAANEPSPAPAGRDEPQPTATPEAPPTAQPAAAAALPAAFQPPPMPEVLPKFTQALLANPDTVGQLQMGESINTYVVQRDNTYYLRRSFAGEYSFSGAVFLDVTCSIYPQSRVLILHGHNMHDGTAFGKLSRFDDIDYLNRYPVIRFSTLYEAASYIPFACVYYSVDPKSDLYLDVYQINLMSGDAFTQFISHVEAMAEYRLPVPVAKTDSIIMVTTCADNADLRFAVFAVKQEPI